jgi:hypothetical protein
VLERIGLAMAKAAFRAAWERIGEFSTGRLECAITAPDPELRYASKRVA